MHSFNDTRLLPYQAELVRDIILDVEKYPEFLPWCFKATLLSKAENELIAELRGILAQPSVQPPQAAGTDQLIGHRCLIM